MTKVQSHVMLVLHNKRMVPSNVRKNKGATKCDKSTVTFDINTTQCEDDTIKCKKKNKRPPSVTKVQLHVMLILHNVRMIPSKVKKKGEPLNVTKDVSTAQCEDDTIKCEKKKGTIECDKSTVTCDVGTT